MKYELVGELTTLTFADITPSINPALVETLRTNGFTQMSPVQASAIGLFLSNKDVCVKARTGSGKTLSFVIPVLEMLLRRELPWQKLEMGALIMSPTRELAQQIYDTIQMFEANMVQAGGEALGVRLCIGGRSVEADVEDILANGLQILIGTPGRILEIFSTLSAQIEMRNLEVLVMDEADRLLDINFQATVNQILGYLPKMRRTGIFSATMSTEVKGLVRAGLRNVVYVNVTGKEGETNATPSSLQHFYLSCGLETKLRNLLCFLSQHRDEKTIVYTLTCACVDYYATIVGRALASMEVDMTVLSIHGKVPQAKREKVYDTFSKGNSCVIFATDLISRGVDVPDVDWVVQLDPPQDPKVFIHRVGRAGRMGRKGASLVFLQDYEGEYVKYLAFKGVQLEPFTEGLQPPFDSFQGRPFIVDLVVKERELMDKGIVAFVSFVRAYKEHLCKAVFSFHRLPFTRLAMAMGLLRLPRMPEIRTPSEGVFEDVEVDVDEIPYKNPAKEANRASKAASKVEKRKQVMAAREKAKPWSKAKEQRTKRKMRREKRQRKRARIEEEKDFDAA